MTLNRNSAAFFLLIEAVTVILLLFPFFQYNNLYSGDMPGHYLSSWYIKDYLFPRAFGWNPFAFAGYPQGQFYPFLFHYLSAILGMFAGLETGFKLVVCASILAAPASFYYFSRKFGLNGFESGICMLLMWFVMFVPDRYIGGNFLSTFGTGLVTNMLAIPLLFFYYGKLADSFKTGKYVVPGILLALIILTHIFIALTALIFLASFYVKKPSKKENMFLVKHGMLSFLLCAFWTLPFLDKLGYSSLTSMPTESVTAFIAISFMLFAFIFFTVARCSDNFRPVVNALGIMVLFIFLGNQLGINLHYYRFFMPVLLLMPVCLISVFKTRLNALNALLAAPVIVSAGLILCLSSLSFISYIPPYGDLKTYAVDPGGPKDIDIHFEKVSGRIMPVALAGTTPAPYSLDNMVPMNTGNWVTWGLFIDSSLQKCAINQIISEFDPYAFRSCGIGDAGYDGVSGSLSGKLDLFDINYVLMSNETGWYDKVLCSNLSFTELDYGMLGDVALSDMLVPSNDYEEGNIVRALSSDNSSIIVLFDNRTAETTRIQNKKCESGSVSFELAAGHNARIFLSSDYRYWRAYAGGKEVVVHDGSSLLSFKGNDTIELKYRENPLRNLKEAGYKDIPAGYKNQTFILYQVGNSSIAEVLDYSPQTVYENWDDTVWKWFDSENISRVLVRSRAKLPGGIGEPGQTVDVLDISRSGEYMKFSVPGEKPVPLYIKVSYFPNWKAYVNGKPAEVYPASPYMMLVYGNGIVELKYEPVISDYLGALLSVSGVIWLLFAFIIPKCEV
ncbi:MAG: hypothetical protein WAX07_02180 [Candidatus Altiarchaeia archaeon]